MQIAVYADSHGCIASPYGGAGGVDLYTRQPSGWWREKHIPFSISPDMGLKDVKAALSALADTLGACRVFIASETRGLLYTLLEDELGFATWRTSGPVAEKLDEVAELQAARLAKEEAIRSAPGHTGCGRGHGSSGTTGVTVKAEVLPDGTQRLDLARALAEHPDLNSQDILFPLLETPGLKKLEILCDHLPRWFSQKLLFLDLRMDMHIEGEQLRVQIFSAKGTLS